MKPYARHSRLNRAARLTGLQLLILLTLLCGPAHAAPLQAYEAGYSLYHNDQRVAKTYFQLAPRHQLWVWSMQTEPTGLYSILTRKKPFAETHLIETSTGWQPLIQIDGDYPDRSPKRAVWFDHGNKRFYYSDHKKRRQGNIARPVYNYHNILLLYRHMKDAGLNELSVLFYRKGRIAKTRVKLERGIELERGTETFITDRLTQNFNGSKRRMTYHFDEHPLAPLRIEQKKEDRRSVMWRDWLREGVSGAPETGLN